MTTQAMRNFLRPQEPHVTGHERPEAVWTIVSAKELSFDFLRRIIVVRGKSVHLTPKEFELLRHLVVSHDRPVSHRRLLQAVWGPTYGQEIELLRVVINQLRKKIERDSSRP